MIVNNKKYLGDAVYVFIDPALGLCLTTEDGTKITNIIYLEADVWESLLRYVDNNWKA